MNEKIHIALAFYDKNGEHSKFAGTTLASVFENTTKSNWSNIVIHILHDDTLTEINRNRFIKLVEEYNSSINFYNIKINNWNIDKEFFEKAFVRISLGALYRLALPKLLKNIDRVIYLDTDILVQIDIYDLYNISFDKFYLLAVSDDENMRNLYIKTRYYKNAGLNYRLYFNSGVLVLNLKEIQKFNLLNNSLVKLQQFNKFADQDILNIIFKDKVKFIDDKFNTLVDIQNLSDDSIEKFLNKKAILHFAGYLKPWNCANKEIIKLYYSYMAKTPWVKNNDDIISAMSDISNEYNRKMDLKNCLYYKQPQGISDKLLLGMKLVLNEKVFKKFLKVFRKLKLKLRFDIY